MTEVRLPTAPVDSDLKTKGQKKRHPPGSQQMVAQCDVNQKSAL